MPYGQGQVLDSNDTREGGRRSYYRDPDGLASIDACFATSSTLFSTSPGRMSYFFTPCTTSIGFAQSHIDGLKLNSTIIQLGMFPLSSFSSTVSVRNSSLPTFSKECGVRGPPQTAVPNIGVDFDALVSASTFPSGSRRMKSLVARM